MGDEPKDRSLLERIEGMLGMASDAASMTLLGSVMDSMMRRGTEERVATALELLAVSTYLRAPLLAREPRDLAYKHAAKLFARLAMRNVEPRTMPEAMVAGAAASQSDP